MRRGDCNTAKSRLIFQRVAPKILENFDSTSPYYFPLANTPSSGIFSADSLQGRRHVEVDGYYESLIDDSYFNFFYYYDYHFLVYLLLSRSSPMRPSLVQ